MSILIDKFIDKNNLCEINGKWYIAKPINKVPLIARISDCIRILNNRSIAVHYKEDELKKGAI